LKVREKLPAETALSLINDITSALSYAITQGITHRDLKMSNVLVSSTGRAKLVDFGLAAIADPKNDKEIADTPNARAIDYAALERGTGVRNGDPRSDLYFTGVILYNILTGKSPLIEANDRAQRLNVTRLKEIPSIQSVDSEIPNVAAAVCSRALEFDPEKRYQSAAEMQAEVRQAIEKLKRGETSSRRDIELAMASVPSPDVEGEGKTIMLVESRLDLQQLLRERLKSKGYRVLVISDPVRALARFHPDDPPPADCVIFSAPDLGNLALQAFNRFGTDPHTANIPAIILVDPQQDFVMQQAELSAHRLPLQMPLKVRELRAALLHLLNKASESHQDQS
jgi:serine/threonine-protein kinase